MAAAPPADPGAHILQLLMGKFITSSLGVVAELKVADALQSGPKDVQELAQVTNSHAPSLYRVLRALASVGVFEETSHHVFRNTPASDVLRVDHPASTRPMALMWTRPNNQEAWMSLGHSVKTGGIAFNHRHGQGLWEYFAVHRDEADIFDNAMTGISTFSSFAVAKVLSVAKAKLVIDVGGGRGFFLGTLLAGAPGVRGIVYDQQYVVDGAGPVLAERGVADRIEPVGGNFFTSVPPGGDVYTLKHILHDWSDAVSACV
jgi:hypothetical protein